MQSYGAMCNGLLRGMFCSLQQCEVTFLAYCKKSNINYNNNNVCYNLIIIIIMFWHMAKRVILIIIIIMYAANVCCIIGKFSTDKEQTRLTDNCAGYIISIFGYTGDFEYILNGS